jgi:hypothetical protein
MRQNFAVPPFFHRTVNYESGILPSGSAIKQKCAKNSMIYSSSSILKRAFCGLAFFLSIGAAGLLAQSTTRQEPQCFSIHVRLNGKPLDGPQVITLKTKENESTVSLEGGCFKVPAALLTEKTLGVLFTVPGNKIDLAAIELAFFALPWDVELEDKKFDRSAGLPKHARIKEACVVVVFHGGEPDREVTQTGCRTPIKAN